MFLWIYIWIYMDWLGVHYPNMLELSGLNQPYSGLQRVKIWSCDLFASLYLAGWWFGTFLFSTIYGIIFPLTNICQDGLKPPTSWCVGRNPRGCQVQCLYTRGYCNCNRWNSHRQSIFCHDAPHPQGVPQRSIAGHAGTHWVWWTFFLPCNWKTDIL